MRISTLLASIAFLVACVPSDRAHLGDDSGSIFVDAAGRLSTFDRPPQRIVSLSPANTEIVYAIGGGGLLVGVTTQCDFPPAAAALPTVGDFLPTGVSMESVLALAPDVVLGDVQLHADLAPAFERTRLLLLSVQGIEDLCILMEDLGELLDLSEPSREATAALRERLQAVTERTSGLPDEKRPRVFWEVWDAPLMSTSRSTFIGQMLEEAGARNIFADSPGDWLVVSPEEVIRRDPQWILAADSHEQTLSAERVARRSGWSSIEAVRMNRILLLDGDIVSRPGPRMIEALERLAAALHPEIFNR